MSRILYVSIFSCVLAAVLSFAINLSLMTRADPIQTGAHFSIGKMLPFSQNRVVF